jgi:selenide,water dikinase
MQSSTPIIKDIVLVGGGHAHVSVLRMFGMNPIPGVRLTLITRVIHTPYSGMLPGFIAGHYDFDDVHIDLGPLATFANARLYHGEVERIDPEAQQVFVKGRPPVDYDVLSINIGSRPRTDNVPGALENALPIKPIDLWLEKWAELQQKLLSTEEYLNIAVVGGGAGGVEVLLSTQHQLQKVFAENDQDPSRLHFELYTAEDDILMGHNKGVRRRFNRVFKERNVSVFANSLVSRVDKETLTINGETRDVNAVLWTTSASAPSWPKQSGLATDELGFIQVDEYLRSASHSNVFAVGDIASMPSPRPKSGVFAVRQGPVLTENLRRLINGDSLKKYKPQKHFLGLISTGDKHAIASHGAWSLEADWLWRWKDSIDRKFMRMFNELPEMPEVQLALPHVADQEALKEISTLAIRCGGCGAKVGSTVLSRVLNSLDKPMRDDVLIGLDSPDDAAVFFVPEGMAMVQSVDYFRSFIDDPYVFGQIAANHALGDLFAMGAQAQSALAIATVPYGREAIVERMLSELLQGAQKVLHDAGAVIAGGHSSEGAELAFGLTVNGLVDKEQVLRKSGMQPGDVLILTKPIGTGTLFAANMRGKAKGRWVDSAIESMLVSNQAASKVLYENGVTACTDVTGFGVLGHLVEMTKASGCDVDLMIDALPLLDGAVETVSAGILSSLQPQNLRLRRAITNAEEWHSHLTYALLFDPQTAGGLLASIHEEKVDDCLNGLRAQGYQSAVLVGRVKQRGTEDAAITLT